MRKRGKGTINGRVKGEQQQENGGEVFVHSLDFRLFPILVCSPLRVKGAPFF